MKYLLSLLANDLNHLEYSIVMIHNKNQVLPHQFGFIFHQFQSSFNIITSYSLTSSLLIISFNGPHQLDRKGDSKDSIQPKSIQSKGNHTSWRKTKHITTILFVVSISISLFQCPYHLTKRLEYPPSSLPSQSSLLLFYTIPIHFLHSISHPSDLEFASIVSLLPLLPLHNNYGINYESLLLTTHHSLSLLILLHTQCIMDSCFWSPENMKDGTLQFVFLHYREDQSTYDSNDSSIFVPVITHIPHKEHIGVMWECLDEIDVDPCCCHSLSSFFLLHLHLFFHFHSISHLSLRISPISLVTLHWYSLPYVNTHNEHHSPHTTIDSLHDSQTSCIYTSIPFSHPTHSNISTDLPNLIQIDVVDVESFDLIHVSLVLRTHSMNWVFMSLSVDLLVWSHHKQIQLNRWLLIQIWGLLRWMRRSWIIINCDIW